MTDLSTPDQVDIWQLTTAYAQALDERDWSALGAVFADDGIMNFAAYGEVKGPEAIAETCASALQRLDLSQHMVGSHRIEVDGDEGRCTCHFLAHAVRADAEGGAVYLIGGTYWDTVKRTEAGWRIVQRDQAITFTDGNPVVMEQ